MRRKKQNSTDIARNALILNAITPSIREHPKYVEVEDQSCEVLNFVNFKSENDVGWADALLNQRNVSVCFRLEPASVAKIKESVDMHERQTKEGLLSARTASQVNDLEREARHGTEILDIMGDNNEKFFMTSISGVLRSEDVESLPADRQVFSSLVESSGMSFKSISWNHLRGLLAASPLRVPDHDGIDQTYRPFPASTIAHALYTKETGLDDGRGINLGIDDMGGLVRIDLTTRNESRHNRNIIIVGMSGSGKSTLAKKLVFEEHILYGSKVIIVDPEGEFSDEVLALGGDVVNVGGGSSTKISIFQPRALVYDVDKIGNSTHDANDVEDSEDASESLVLSSTIPFVKSFLQLAFGINNKNMNLLEIALEHAYAKYGITKETTFKQYQAQKLSYPIMKDLYDSCLELSQQTSGLGNAESFTRIALNIRSAAVGIQASIWNTRSTFKLDSPITSINTLDIGEDERMKAAWYYNILTWCWSEVRMAPSTGRPIRIVMDEAHTIINPRYLAIADMVKSMVKRIRKRGGGTTIIFQEVNDCLAESIKAQGAAILNNATYKFIGQAEAENISELKKLYGMPEALVERIKKAKKGNFAFFAGTQDRTWLQVKVPEWLLKLFGKGGGV